MISNWKKFYPKHCRGFDFLKEQDETGPGRRGSAFVWFRNVARRALLGPVQVDTQILTSVGSFAMHLVYDLERTEVCVRFGN